MLVGTKRMMTMLMIDLWKTGRRGGGSRRKLLTKGKNRLMKKNYGPHDVVPIGDRLLEVFVLHY
jgi:hypothetical protein